MTKTIVILGAGLSAAIFIRHTMRTIVLPSNEYRLVVVAPNTHMHWTIAMPRVIVPGQISEDKAMHSYLEYWKEYPADKFEFVQGVASSLDVQGRIVSVGLNDGGEKEVAYDALVVATGTITKDGMPWKAMGPTEKTKQVLKQVQDEISNAKTIVVAGGGLTGTETAAELGFEYSKTGKKEVIWVHSDALPLAPPVKDSVRKQAKLEISRLNVNIISNARVTNVTRANGETTIEVTKGGGSKQTLTAQAYIPALGQTPNSDFLPTALLDTEGRVKQSSTLQVAQHPEIFVMGDVGNLQPPMAQTAENQAKYLMQNFGKYLSGGGKAKLPDYAPNKVAFAVTLGRSKATGQVGGIKMPGFIISYMKGRTMFTEAVPLYAKGTKTMSATYEK